MNRFLLAGMNVLKAESTRLGGQMDDGVVRRRKSSSLLEIYFPNTPGYFRFFNTVCKVLLPPPGGLFSWPHNIGSIVLTHSIND